MKRAVSLLLACAIIGSLASCGNKSSVNTPVSAGYLPTRLEQISEGGVVPEGCEAKTHLENSDFSIESLWGEWVLKGSSTGDVHNTDQIFTYEVSDDSDETIQLEVEYLPKRFSLGPSYATSEWKLNQTLSSASSDELEPDQFGKAFENLGYGYGVVEFQGTKEGSNDPLMPVYITAYGRRASCFAISDNILAIGVTDEETLGTLGALGWTPPDAEETNIIEIDYEISWTGYELTLTYNGDSAVYVPYCIENNASWKLGKAGVISGSSAIDGIYGITYDSSSQSILYDVHNGYVDASMVVNDDGTAEIDGNFYTYRYSGDSLTLISENSSAVYSNYTVQKQSIGAMADSSFYVGDKHLRYSGANTVQWFLDNGFQTDLDLDQYVNPYQVTNEILLDYGGTKLTVKANNPYEKPAALKDCYVCYILINDTTGVIKKANGFFGDAILGQTTYEDIELIFESPYEKKESYLRYKTRYSGGIVLLDFAEEQKRHQKYGYEQLDLSENLDVIYEFQDGILKDVIIQEPSLLYNGLQDNVDYSMLNSMDTATMTGIIEVRDSVLEQLKKAFNDAGISVNINESTGEIVMDSTVLFDTDSSILSTEGQNYIDSFMGAYASVILDNSLKDVISEVRFEGHTDSSGSYDYNLDLSQKRADAVLSYCLSSDATSMNRDQKERLNNIASTIGYSYADLVYDENGNEDAEASRRVAIKFYIEIGAETNAASSNEQSVSTASSELTADDFKLITEGESYNLLEDSDSGSAWYFHYDSANDTSRENVVETARGIHVGDSANDLFTAYGNTDTYTFDADNPFYSPDDYRSAMLDECKTFVMYWYNDEDAIVFFLDDWNCVSWIVYYIA